MGYILTRPCQLFPANISKCDRCKCRTMSECVRRNKETLSFLCNCKAAYLKAILANADKDLIDALTELADNSLHSDLQLEREVIDSLHKHIRVLRRLADKRAGVRVKRELLLKSGASVLPKLLPPLLDLLGPYLDQDG